MHCATLLFFFLAALNLTGAAAQTPAGAAIRIVATHPAPTATLARRQSFYVQFEVKSPAEVIVAVDALYKGQPVSTGMGSSTPVKLQAGGGTGMASFFYWADQPTRIDELRLLVSEARSAAPVRELRFPVNLTWSAEDAALPQELAPWVSAWQQAQQVLLNTEREQSRNRAAGHESPAPKDKNGISPMLHLVVAAVVFLVTHLVTSTPLRARLVAALGRSYIAAYSLVAFATLAWMIWAFHHAPFLNLWYSISMARVPQVLMPFALVFIVCALSARNPTLPGNEHVLKQQQPARGIFRITRHPLMWGLALWAAGHIAARGEVAAVIFFGTFLLLALAGTVLIDRRKAATLGDSWRHFTAVTSNVPFAAIAGGRNRLVPGEIDWWKVVIGIALYFVLLRYHALLFGARPLI